MSTSKVYRRSHVDELAKIFEQFCVEHHIPSNLLSAPCYVLSAIEDAASETWVSFYFYLLHVSLNVSLYVLPLVSSSVLHVVSLPTYFHPFVSFNDIYTPIYLASYI
jgi:hypothetical protein